MYHYKIINAACWALLLLFSATMTIYAHGTMYDPPSRSMVCIQEGAQAPSSDACRAAKQVGGTQPLYDWDGVNQNPAGNHQAHVPDGQLCNGGQGNYVGLNLPRYDWPASALVPDENGNVNMVYAASAPHQSDHWRFYVTKDSWIEDTQSQVEGEPNRKLYWSDLEDEPFCELGNIPKSTTLAVDVGAETEIPTYEFECPAPQNKDGRHVVYAIWQRSDSPEAFYSCSDVILGPAALITPTPLPPSLCNALNYSPAVEYRAGDRAVYENQEWEAKWWVKGGLPGRDGAWKLVVEDCGATPPQEDTPTPTSTPTSIVDTATNTPTPTATATNTPVVVATNTPTSTPSIPLSVGQSAQLSTPHNSVIVLALLIIISCALLVTGAAIYRRQNR